VTAEPDMEHLLASIRKAIDSDIGENAPIYTTATGGTPFRGAIRDLRVKFENNIPRNSDSEIMELRNKINRKRTENAIAEPEPRRSLPAPQSSSRSGFAGILGGDVAMNPVEQTSPGRMDTPPLRSSYATPAAQDYEFRPAYEEADTYPPEAPWVDENEGYLPAVANNANYQEYPPQPLMSNESTVAANTAFGQLADTLMARALGERSIEDMTHDLLKGMLKTWLDNNLPPLVERLVREEIERVARRGR
jgi:uncharacterized protein